MTFVTLPVTKAYQPAPPPVDPQVNLQINYLLVKRNGSMLRFQELVRGSRGTSIGPGFPYESGTIFQFIDPLSAMWLGLVTPEELGMTQTTLAVLKLAMDDLIP